MKKKRGEEKLHLHTVLFTMLITLLLMLCFQRALLVAAVISLAEQWRARIFVLLNLLLLSVFFTSLHFTRSCDHLEEETIREKEPMRIRERIASKKHRQCNMHGVIRRSNSNDAEKRCRFSCNKKSKVEEDVELLSEEELNRRSEAFIAMFRQHLISDSKRRSRYVTDSKTVKHAVQKA